MSEQPVIHDGQGDAMPCGCPACRSAFIARTGAPLPKRCPAWCGDGCDCGRGPESIGLDPVDLAGMRAVEGRT